MFDELIESIGIEISEIQKSRKKKYINIEYYKQLSQIKKNYLIYEIYVSEYVSKMAEDLEIELIAVKHKLDAVIISVDENQMIKIKTKEPLTEEIYRINMEFDPSFLLVNLSKCIEKTRDSKNPIVQNLLARIPENKKIEVESYNIEYKDLNNSQIQAIESAEKNQITLIWGPPGTGKTYTLSKIIMRSYLRDEKVLVLSTSNVALDHILLNLHKELEEDERNDILRLGNTNNKIAHSYTKETENFVEKKKNVTFSTLANLSSKYDKLNDFDLVLIDEVSMVSLPYIFIASNKSRRNIVLLGDFRQLPPIALNENNKLFQLSIFEYLDIPKNIDNNKNIPYMAMLNTQYRMVEQISEMTSKMFYNNLLLCGVKKKYKKPLNFINVDDSAYKETFYSIPDKSYFNPISILLIESLLENEINTNKEILIVSPFRPQQNILNALFRDKQEYDGRSLTVHKAQGSEADIVIFDLTTHNKTNKTDYHHFFIDSITANLVNVAMSRAKERLYIIGSLKMVNDLARNNSHLWSQMKKNIDTDFFIRNSTEILKKNKIFNLEEIDLTKLKNFTVVDTECDKNFYTPIRENKIQKRNYLTYEGCIGSEERREVTFRDLKKSDRLPYMVFMDNKIILKNNVKYLWTSMEKTSKILQRVALESFIDTVEVDRASTFTLSCENHCGGTYMLQNNSGYPILSCSNCRNKKNIGKNEALLIKDLYKIKCPECNAEVTPRTKNGHSNYSFYGCSNYPHCKGTVYMSNIANGY